MREKELTESEERRNESKAEDAKQLEKKESQILELQEQIKKSEETLTKLSSELIDFEIKYNKLDNVKKAKERLLIEQQIELDSCTENINTLQESIVFFFANENTRLKK